MKKFSFSWNGFFLRRVPVHCFFPLKVGLHFSRMHCHFTCWRVVIEKSRDGHGQMEEKMHLNACENVLVMELHAFCFISNGFFGPGSDVAKRNPKFPKIGLTLPDKRCLKYYLGREQSFDNGFRVIFRDRF